MNLKSVFFGVVALSLAVAAGFQFWLVHKLKNQCVTDLRIAPVIAGGCLTGSFLFNALWLGARAKMRPTTVRAALFLWVVLVTVGTVAAGATLGQLLLRGVVCPTLVSDIPLVLLQYASIGLLVFSISVPHALKKRGGSVQPASNSEEGGPFLELKKPLVFL